MRPAGKTGRMSVIRWRLALLDDVVRAVVPDLEDREADASGDVTRLVERHGCPEDRVRHLDLADLSADLRAADLAVRACSRDAHRHRLDGDERGGTERDRLSVLLLERRGGG